MVQVTHTVRLASLWTRLSRALQGKEVVGVDALGTTYLRYQATNDTGQVVDHPAHRPLRAQRLHRPLGLIEPGAQPLHR